MVQILYYILLAIDHSFIVKKDEDSVDIASEIFKHKHPPETKDLSCSGRGGATHGVVHSCTNLVIRIVRWVTFWEEGLGL